MSKDPSLSQSGESDDAAPSTWAVLASALNRPYPITASMVAFVALVPLYIFIPELRPQGSAHALDTFADRWFPLQPTWSIVYGALYLFLILLPVLLIRDLEHVRRTVRAYLAVWLTAYGFFVFYPTIAPRPLISGAHSFGAWGLSLLYSADTPYNCFPSLHVAHSFVSALTCGRLHRGVGRFALLAAFLVGLSTLFTKQHYILDVLAGVVLAALAYGLFLRTYRPDDRAVRDAETAPLLTVFLLGMLALATGCSWLLYLWAVA